MSRTSRQVVEAFRDRRRASAGTSTTPICSAAPSASSARATTPISSSRGSPRSTAWTRSCEAGARVADVGCGHGASTIVMAQAYPRVDASSASTTTSRRSTPRASAAERGGRRRPRDASRSPAAKTYPGTRLRPVSHSSTACTTWATRSAPRATCASRWRADGTWLIVEPFADDAVEDNLNPVGRIFYSASTMICTPALAEPGGRARARRPGRRAAAARGAERGRLQPLPARDRDAVQSRVRGAAVARGAGRRGDAATRTLSRAASPPARLSSGISTWTLMRVPGSSGSSRQSKTRSGHGHDTTTRRSAVRVSKCWGIGKSG